MSKSFFFFAALLCLCTTAWAQLGYNERARKYIEDYAEYAMTEQLRSGVPAAITLGQGILETEAGASELMTQANNHFGIKCKSDWTGPSFAHDDDAPGECFKKYESALESYRDHSDFLKKSARYAPLFVIPVTDYTKWAMTLRKCGYATNPQYGQRLSKIIEEFGLQHYTWQAMNQAANGNTMMAARNGAAPATAQPGTTRPVAYAAGGSMPAGSLVSQAVYRPSVPDTSDDDEDAEPVKPAVAGKSSAALAKVADSARRVVIDEDKIPELAAAPPPIDTSKIVIVNGLKAVYVPKGEQLLPYAVKYNVRYAVLLEMNDLPDAAMPFDGYVYLQKKHTTGLKEKHVVQAGETLLMAAQAEGIQLKRLMALNKLYPREEPATGATLELQNTALTKPELKAATATAAHTKTAIGAEGGQKGGYITLNKQGEGNDTDTAAHQFVDAAATAPIKDTRPQGGLLKPRADSARVVAKPAAITPQAPQRQDVDTVYGIDEKRDMARMQWAKPDTTHPVAKKPVTEEAQEPVENDVELGKLKDKLDNIVYTDGRTAPTRQLNPGAKPVEGLYYTIRKGDTAYSIAKSHSVTVQQIYKWNNIDADGIKVGRTIKVGD